jgi:hypothetical protein
VFWDKLKVFLNMIKYLFVIFVFMSLVNCLETGWISSSLSPMEMIKIYEEYHVGSDHLPRSRNFERFVLAYVTPWNSNGYDIAKHFRGISHS